MTFNEVLVSSCRVLDPCSVSRENSKNDKEILKKLSQDIIQIPVIHKRYVGSRPIHHLELIRLIEFILGREFK